MQACESAYSSWKFSGGFRTWVKMSLVETKEDGREAVEFRQEVGGAGLTSHRPGSTLESQVQGILSEGSALPRGLRGEWMFARKRMSLPLGARCVFLLQAWPAPDPLLFVPAALRAHMLERFTEWCLAQLDLSWRVALLHSLLPSELAAAFKKKRLFAEIRYNKSLLKCWVHGDPLGHRRRSFFLYFKNLILFSL